MKRQWISAILMVMTGWCIFAASDFYRPRPLTAADSETETMKETTTSGQTDTFPDVAENTLPLETEDDTSYQPAPDELNLAHYFPEGEDTSNLMKSYAGKAFIELMTQDQIWIGKIYDYADIAPEQLASRIGKPRSAVLGKYNPRDDRHNPEDPSSWTINSFRDMRIRVLDGDHQPISLYSNVIEIMSMANVYTYYKGAEDYDLFVAYYKALWERSHSYSISISDIEYCDGCLTEEDERKQLEREAEVEETSVNAVGNAGYTAEDEDDFTNQDQQNAETYEESIEIETNGRNITEGSESAAAETDIKYAVKGSENGAVEADKDSGASGSGTASSESAAVRSMTIGTNQKNAAEESSPVIITENANAGETGNAERSAGSETAETSSQANQSPNSKSEAIATPSDYKESSSQSYQCPGHVDLIVQIHIRGLKEKNGLFKADSYGNDPDNFEEDGWQGWDQESVDAVKRLSGQDWYEKYKMTVSMISSGNPLTSAEIEAYLNRLPDSISQTRKDLVRFALSSVGKVPYYWGGKASAPNYSRNAFGSLVSPDYKGRVLKGLDCSGWISWVYWSVTGKRLPYESTSGLALCGTPVSRSSLLPGDIILRTGENAHVIMFLEWTEDGKIRCIHESSGDVNNVMVSVRDANWPYYRKLID